MSAEHKNDEDPSKDTPDSVLRELDRQLAGPSDYEAQQLCLSSLQLRQQQALEKAGTADRAREALLTKNQDALELRRLTLQDAVGSAETAETGPLPPELTADISGENTRLWLATIRHNDKGEVFDRLYVFFSTTTLDNGQHRTITQFVPMAEGYTDGTVPAESFHALPGFTDEDTKVASRELEDVRKVVAEGQLPDIDSSLGFIPQPADSHE